MFSMSCMTLLAAVAIALLGSRRFWCRDSSILRPLTRPSRSRSMINGRTPSFFEKLPPELRNLIYDEVFGVDERLHLRPIIPRPEPTSFLGKIGRFFATAQTPSVKLANLVVSKQWYADGQTYFIPNAVYDLSDDHCGAFFSRKGKQGWDGLRKARHIIIPHTVAEKFPFYDMPNLQSCIIRRSYSKQWKNTSIRFLIIIDGEGYYLGPNHVNSFMYNPAECLMQIEASRFVRVLQNIQNGIKSAGTDPQILVRGVWWKANPYFFDVDTVSRSSQPEEKTARHLY